jgi:hypothetical protein
MGSLARQRFVDFLAAVAPRFDLHFNLNASQPVRPGSVSLTPQIAAFFQIKPLKSSHPLLCSSVLLE